MCARKTSEFVTKRFEMKGLVIKNLLKFNPGCVLFKIVVEFYVM